MYASRLMPGTLAVTSMERPSLFVGEKVAEGSDLSRVTDRTGKTRSQNRGRARIFRGEIRGRPRSTLVFGGQVTLSCW
jgi:hypothetical protein